MNSGQIPGFQLAQEVADGWMTREEANAETSETILSGKRATTLRLRKRHHPTAKVTVSVEAVPTKDGFYSRRPVVELRVPRRQFRKFLGNRNVKWLSHDGLQSAEERYRHRQERDRAAEQEIRSGLEEMELDKKADAEDLAVYFEGMEADQDYADHLAEMEQFDDDPEFLNDDRDTDVPDYEPEELEDDPFLYPDEDPRPEYM